jgi:hypothetical protein
MLNVLKNGFPNLNVSIVPGQFDLPKQGFKSLWSASKTIAKTIRYKINKIAIPLKFFNAVKDGVKARTTITIANIEIQNARLDKMDEGSVLKVVMVSPITTKYEHATPKHLIVIARSTRNAHFGITGTQIALKEASVAPTLKAHSVNIYSDIAANPANKISKNEPNIHPALAKAYGSPRIPAPMMVLHRTPIDATIGAVCSMNIGAADSAV